MIRLTGYARSKDTDGQSPLGPPAVAQDDSASRSCNRLLFKELYYYWAIQDLNL